MRQFDAAVTGGGVLGCFAVRGGSQGAGAVSPGNRDLRFVRSHHGNGESLAAGTGEAFEGGGGKRLNLSLDTLDVEKYAYITRIGSLTVFQAGLDAVRRSHTGRDMNQIGG